MEAIPWCFCSVVVMHLQMQGLEVGIRGLARASICGNLHRCAQWGLCSDPGWIVNFVRIESLGRMFDGDAALPPGWWLPLTGWQQLLTPKHDDVESPALTAPVPAQSMQCVDR